MEDASLPKRRRVVTTCSECHRRKQKCNRELPCNVCIARNVPDQCSYGPSSSSIRARFFSIFLENKTLQIGIEAHGRTRSSRIPQRRKLETLPTGNIITEADSPNGLGDQLGLSSRHESNFLFEDQEISGHSDGIQDSSIKPSHGRSEAIARLSVLVEQLPPQPVIEELKEVFFSQANWYYLVLTPYFFNAKLKSWQKARNSFGTDLRRWDQDLRHFSALLFQVLANALQFLSLGTTAAKSLRIEDYVHCDRLSQEYSAIGMQIMDILGRYNPTVTSAEHDMLRAAWLKCESRGKEAWYILGNAIRQAQDLGLHLQSSVNQENDQDLEETLLRLWYEEHKRRLWCAMFIWDGHMAWVLGRPRSIHIDECTVAAPLDGDIPDEPSKRIPQATSSLDKPSSYSAKLLYYALSLKAHEMMSWGINKKHYKDYTLIRKMHDDIIELLDQLPPTVRPDSPDTSFDEQYPFLPLQRQCASSVGQAFLMALHRPHMAQHEESRQAAIKAALDCLQAQQALFDLCGEQFYKMYTLSFYTIEPSIFLSATALGTKAPDRMIVESILAAVGQGIARFSLMQKRSTIARSGLPILSNCYQKLSRRVIELNSQFGMPNDIVTSISSSSEPNPTWLPEQTLGPMDLQHIDDLSFQTDLSLPLDTLEYLAAIEQSDPSSLSAFPDDGDIAPSWMAP